ncbi:MAG TPA: hypothetical protein VLG44_06305 [Chlamydiales bacterium]|nr:hypothetical protein [Chlamydiales bacterium]
MTVHACFGMYQGEIIKAQQKLNTPNPELAKRYAPYINIARGNAVSIFSISPFTVNSMGFNGIPTNPSTLAEIHAAVAASIKILGDHIYNYSRKSAENRSVGHFEEPDLGEHSRALASINALNLETNLMVDVEQQQTIIDLAKKKMYILPTIADAVLCFSIDLVALTTEYTVQRSFSL